MGYIDKIKFIWHLSEEARQIG